ncbi:hypothetical protein OPV22_004055 [Ensete ventricosum]|uniref:Phosphoglycerate mutase-like protein 1 n=1 Tax=Ensete ventricosum TaxID=4639 RepID=A0AAV8S2Q4_ENSVE|nr:hypothetical protein OPV22_004055 [Ensete ventricosum]
MQRVPCRTDSRRPIRYFKSPLPSFRRLLSTLFLGTPLLLLRRLACRFGFSEMDGVTSSGLFPLQRCKTIHVVRHAQGIHNKGHERDHRAYSSSEFFDAHLTPLGWDQVDNLRKHIKSCGLSKRIELVIASPLLRTMQTAVGVFGGDGYEDGVNITPPLMVENTGESGRPAISSLNCPPFMAVEDCRERLGVNPCDKRRSISEYQKLFPAIDFSLAKNDADVLWKADIRETNEEVAARGVKFISWLCTLKEKEIAVVTHSAFLFHTLQMFGGDCHPIIKEEIGKQFGNCLISKAPEFSSDEDEFDNYDATTESYSHNFHEDEAYMPMDGEAVSDLVALLFLGEAQDFQLHFESGSHFI